MAQQQGSVVLITGGSGLVGTHLTRRLQAHGHLVRHLSRHSSNAGPAPTYAWNIRKGFVDPRALEGVDHVVHLSGAGIADGRWTRERKKVLCASRVDAAHVLRNAVERSGNWPSTFISASGINVYGTITSDHVFTETDPPANDFIGELCQAWEQAADAWADRCRVVKLRTATVMAREGGALPKLSAPARWGASAPLGTGRQWVPWVHIEDLARAYHFAIGQDDLRGAYNVAAPEDVRNRELMRMAAHALHRPSFLPPVPGFLLRLALDGPAGLVLNGSRVSGARLAGMGLTYQHPQLLPALQELLG
jgi:uncharacterized protein (TIGR01777 family)